MSKPHFLDRLGAASQRASTTATVCTGSALLARTGLLDHRPATSNKLAWDWVVQQGPQVQWPGMPRQMALDVLHRLAEEVFPKVRQE